jgi:3-dehydroquinate dehydratase / shikimate dehydrogenase
MSAPRLCVTVTAATTAELRAERDLIADGDLIELRLDAIRDPDVAGALAGRKRPAIVTCRAAWEGGSFTGPEDARARMLNDALARGAEYVDVEWRAAFTPDLLTRTAGRRIVLSMHAFESIPVDLEAQIHAMLATNAEIVKVAVKASRLSDCVALRDVAARAASPGRLAVIAMGDYGVASRVLPGRFGSPWTYAGSRHEVGQLGADEMLATYRFRKLGESTAIYGVCGGSVGHSVSPSMINAAFASAGLDAVYLPLPAVDADDLIAFGRGFGISGASVTIPHKTAMVSRVDEIDDIAHHVGAINTVRIVDGRWFGTNTDVAGFLAPLRGRVATKGLRAAVLGAGGAARAVVAALVSGGASVTLHARNVERAAQFADRAPIAVAAWPPPRGSWDLLVNCTPIGMYPDVDRTPLAASELTGRYVYDLVYNPSPTRLLREAADAGCQTIDGLAMLVAQAQEQFVWWTGIRPPTQVMRDAARKRLSEFARDEDYVV